MTDLILSPHADDEALGCSRFLWSNTTVYICGIDESTFLVDRPPLWRRMEEAKKVEEFTGSTYYFNTVTKVNYLEVTSMVSFIEDMINKVKPEHILIPHPGYNQDHRVVYEAAKTALRPHDTNFFVPKVLVYEGIHDFIWSDRQFIPNLFLEIDIDRKLEIFGIYKTQQRSYRSADTIKQMACLRGAMSQLAYAEAFQILRWVDK